MSETYENFARDTYATVNQEVTSAVEQADGMPILVFSGAQHSDSIEFNWLTPGSWEEPAMAAAYTHISAIRSAVDAVGAENVIVSFEFDQQKLDIRQGLIRQRVEDDLAPEPVLEQIDLVGNPVYAGLYYAMENNIEVVASDPEHRINPDSINPMAAYDPIRLEAEIGTLSQHALREENTPKVVVHIGGAAHIANLQGVTPTEFSEGIETAEQDTDDVPPFEGVYGSTVFFNSYQQAPLEPGVIIPQIVDYGMDPRNATQIDPPGYMDEEDRLIQTIIDRVDTTANEVAATPPTPDAAPDAGTNPSLLPGTR